MNCHRFSDPCIAFAVIAVTALAVGSPSQEPISEGPVLAIAQACSIDGASSVPSASSSSLLFSSSDLSVLPPDEWAPVIALPDFSIVLDGLPLDLDAFSIGYDYIQSTPTGVGIVPPGSWAGVTFSVTRATTGSSGGRIRTEVSSAGGAAGDIFFYVLPGSALPLSLVDRTMRNQDSKELNVDAAGAPGNIDAHDIYVSLFFRENPSIVPLLPFISVWFSVTGASVAAVPPAWWGAAPPSGATILRRDWIAGAWTTPYPAFTPAMLGLASIEDVDALAVDLLRGRVLFSTTRPSATPGAPLRDPVLFHSMGSPGNFVYVTSSLVPISARLGLDAAGGIDDVDGICALDPGAANQPRLDVLIGRPAPSLIPTLPTALGTSVSRRRARFGTNDEFVSYMTGWPQPGVPSTGVAALLIALGSPSNPMVLWHAATRPNVASPYVNFQGHPVQAVLPIPNTPSLVGLGVFFQWVAFDGFLLDVGHPTGIRI